MGRKKAPRRKSKKIYLFIVEGCTEENYIKRLKQLHRKSASIKNCEGNAKTVILEAFKLIEKHTDDYAGYVVWFDADTFSNDDKSLRLTLEQKADVFVSKPCVENWLLAHFQRPLVTHSTCKQCENALKKHIKGYVKREDRNCRLLGQYITLENCHVAAENYPPLAPIPFAYWIM